MNGPTSKNKLCFISKVKPPYRKKENRLKFRVCKYENARVAHENAVNDILGKPISIPDPYLIKNPIWSTWAKYKKNVDTKTVLDYANQIVKSAYPRGQLEIDDDWETCYGSAIFNKNKFPDVKQLVKELKSLGFKVSLWTHPFISPQCESYEFAKTKDFFVKNTTGSIETAWWNGAAALVDFTNPSARDWWSGRLKKLLVETGIDTLKFDAGESSWGPPSSVYYDKDLTFFPDNIVNAYIDTINEFGNGIEYRTARKVQKHGRFVRMNDRNSRWDWQLGLPTLVTTLIQFNMIGYPFVLPDMIGGNAYRNDTVSDELFIRWMQANTFMPAVQFSLTPWDYNERTNSICKKFMDLHQKYADLIVQLMENAVSTGTPVNPPIWWIDPTDTTAFYIDDEFLLGEDILVAPIMVQNAIKRNIYLPAGKWKDENNPNGSLINGRKWI
ncbi:myogenesis-regulating glycosidase-like, partial [Daktulosphaira vitifoliae]